MKKNILMSFITFSVCFSLVGCNNKVSSSVPPSFTNTIEAKLVEDEDYVEHSKTYGDDEYIYDESMWYVNNLDKLPLPDPHIYVENGVYYITGTSDRSLGKYIDCYTTTDFVEFELFDAIYSPDSFDGWEANSPQIYAPEIYCFDGVYYLYYSAQGKDGKRYNSVVQSKNILGPYEPIVNTTVDGLNNPVFNNDSFDVLDATIFVDDDNKMYMYYAISCPQCQHIIGVEMKSPYEANWDTAVDLVKPGYLSTESPLKVMLWEMYKYYTIAEAPYMVKSNGKYYLTYSVNGCWNKYYSVCYAVSETPLGNFEKPYAKNQAWTNLLLGYSGTGVDTSKVYNQWSGFASGTGHHCFFNIGDQTMIGYHAHQNRDWNSETGYTDRYFAIDYLFFDKDGVPFCNGPTYSLQPLPEAISGYKNIAPNATVRVENVTNGEAINDKYNVDCYNLSQEEGKEVVLGNGYSYIELTFDKEYTIGGVAIYNSAYYDKYVNEVQYVDFGNGNAVKNLVFLQEKFINDETEFVFPNSAFTVEFYTTFKANKLTICFNLPEGGQINEIVVLGK